MNTFWSDIAPAVCPPGAVPGCSTASVETSRPRLGSSVSASAVSVEPTVALVVCNSAPSVAATSTVVDVLPTFNVALIVSAVPTSTFWPLIFCTANPGLVMTIEYVSGARFTITYRPDSFVRVVWTLFVAVSVIFTSAPGITEPWSSVTRPAIELVEVACEKAGVEVSASTHTPSSPRKSVARPIRKSIFPSVT